MSVKTGKTGSSIPLDEDNVLAHPEVKRELKRQVAKLIKVKEEKLEEKAEHIQACANELCSEFVNQASKEISS